MRKASLSRRGVIAGIAAAPATTAFAAPDTELLALGRQFDEVTRILDATEWSDAAAVARLDEVEAAILGAEATTMEGLAVKARAAYWARLGDLDQDGESTDQRMALSIIRDLIRLHDPALERPGALTKLVEECTS